MKMANVDKVLMCFATCVTFVGEFSGQWKTVKKRRISFCERDTVWI